MLQGTTLLAVLSTGAIFTLGTVYLWSGDPSRRRRAWRLLCLLLRK
jgi:hypothetical protein